VVLAESHPTNKLLAGRGPAGTHDIPLGLSILESLASINTLNDQGEYERSVELPTFDKSLYSGQGDRSTKIIPVDGPIDIVLFEGWMMGFTPLPSSLLSQIYSEASNNPKEYEKRNSKLDYERTFFLDHEEKELQVVNSYLTKGYQKMWDRLGAFIQLRPERMSYTWEWRLEVSYMSLARLMLSSLWLTSWGTSTHSKSTK
jgi:D-glycerate 3-kinase